MQEWFGSLFGERYAAAVLWTLAALVLLVLVLIVVRIARRVGSGSFSAGGRNRHRLGVTETVSVDSQRKLVLVRRDNVEHLILIGGPGDVVVEQDIRRSGADMQPRSEPAVESIRSPERAAVRQEPAARPEPAPVPAPVISPQRVENVETAEARTAPPVLQAVETPPRPQPQHADAPAPAAGANNLHAVSVERPVAPSHDAGHSPVRADAAPNPVPADRSRSEIDDEMSRLLDEIHDEVPRR